jgi:hypothetical protein
MRATCLMYRSPKERTAEYLVPTVRMNHVLSLRLQLMEDV